MHYWLHNSIFLSLLFLFFHAALPVQEISFVQLKENPEFTISSGENQPVILSFLIREGYHIQANQVRDENLIPSALTFEAPEGLILGDPVFPQAVEFEMKGEEEAWLVFNDVLEIYIPVTTAKAMGKGAYLIKGNLYYQACKDSKCYFPRIFPFTMKINVK